MATYNVLDDAFLRTVSGKRVLVRSDLNVPLDGSTITDDGRIRASVPTIRRLADAGARVVVTAQSRTHEHGTAGSEGSYVGDEPGDRPDDLEAPVVGGPECTLGYAAVDGRALADRERERPTDGVAVSRNGTPCDHVTPAF